MVRLSVLRRIFWLRDFRRTSLQARTGHTPDKMFWSLRQALVASVANSPMAPKVACVLIFAAASQLQAAKVKVTLSEQTEKQWKPEQLALIREATQIVFDRIASTKVAKCAYRNSVREQKGPLRERWGKQIPVLNKRRQVHVDIQAQTLEAKVLGQAKVGVAQVDRNNYTIQNLSITLNELRLNQELEQAKKGSASLELDRWVNTIAHEFVHNLGYSHGSGSKDWFTDYAGYFVTEIGYCIVTNGRYGSHMGNKDKKKRLLAVKRSP